MNAFPKIPTRLRTLGDIVTAALMLGMVAQLTPLPARAADQIYVNTVERIPTNVTNGWYPANRPPLAPSPLIKLSIGSITPKGWLRHQLELEAAGMTGHLEEISKWCKFEDSAWASADGQGKFGWEELPYWLKGYGDLGYVLKDPTIIAHAHRWIDRVLASQDPDGYFGPRANKTGLEGKPDLWPHMVMLNVLQSFYEYSQDPRVLPFMTRYLKWLNAQPPETFGRGYWPKIRFGDNIESAYWLYNRTGEAWLLDLGKKIHENMARWDTGVINWHNVNLAQGFREPGVYYMQARDEKLLDAAERNYQTIMGLYGQFPGGGFAGDENCRPGHGDPRQGFETCGIVEFMHSFEMLIKISGSPLWADRCEELAFNSLPASLTPDLKGLHYLTCANQVQLDTKNKAPALDNGGNMFAYSPFEVYRCCQHNVSHGWPYYAEELWLATAGGGLCASLYSACEVAAKVGDGTSIRITEETDYPFGDSVNLKISTDQKVRFPLYLRIPRWCLAAAVELNGQATRLAPKPLSYAVLDRTWSDGDRVTLHLPMRVVTRTWEKNNHAVSVNYGPLTFSLKIGELWSRYGGTEAWPEFEVFPNTAWNYGLELGEKDPAKSFEIVKKPGALPQQPFTPDTAPIELRVSARKIPAWQQDWFGLVGQLQPSPVKSDQPSEQVKLIPMGAARLRISAFPVIGHGSNAHEWTAPKALPVSASYCNESDTIEALIDGIEPKNSKDKDIPRFTWWDHRGTTEWVQYDFGKQRKVSSVEVYWFDDTGAGQCRVPQSWRVLYQDGERWKPVEQPSGYTTNLDRYNKVTFAPVQTTGLRIEVTLQPQFSGGILEWKVGE
jgi:beta-L-arabinofuranosidase (glycosyl hydrolase family 127)/glycosyl hydrolase family 127 (putative beta-L-arabinofuranosidase)/F5/8 type C domain-containing protein